MYSRSYYQDEAKLTPPENYDGTAFMQNEEAAQDAAEPVGAIADFSGFSSPPEPNYKKDDKNEDGSILAGLSNLPFLSGLFGKGDSALRFPKIGTEEILILAAAAFLFFSKNGDKETAVILLILLLIN